MDDQNSKTDSGLDNLEQLQRVFEDKSKTKAFVNQTGQDAQAWLDRMQQLADRPNLPSGLRSSILTTMLRLSKRSGLYPTCLTIHNVRKLGNHYIAAGGFGEVWKGTIGRSGDFVCLKLVKIYLSSDLEKLSKAYMQEGILWRQMNHPNILPFLGIYYLEDTGQICLISPWMEKGNLRQYLRSIPREDVEHYTLVHILVFALPFCFS
ncbi:hypothetical protein L218DRAFT_881940 [Marasmius fiardii PR-910]|nr:hypothetical protein L218DRAFT_881940 [Marasmius fiardii PR-910]